MRHRRLLTKKENGQVLIIALLFMVVVMVLVIALLNFVGQNVVATRKALAREQALLLADAGINKAIWRLNQTAGGYIGESDTFLELGIFDITVVSLSATRKEIISTAYVPNKTSPVGRRQIRVEASIDTTSASFNYGVQAGEGGLVMRNNSLINGNVYSNGPIVGAPGALITGDAISAEAGGRISDRLQIDGNARAHRIDTNVTIGGNAYGQQMDRVTVGGNVFTNSLSNCNIAGSAYFSSISSCSVGGTQNPGYPGDPDPPFEDLPITDEDIDGWKLTALYGGSIIGDFVLGINEVASLGPKRITGNLTVSNNSKLILTGTIWVEGSILVSNNGIIALDSSYGNHSEILVADGIINVTNDAFFEKAGPDSYIVMTTTASSDPAFNVANNSDSLIAYAPHGAVIVANDALLREITGWRIWLNNEAQVIYETGLASLEFSSGPGATWRIVSGTWRETR